MYFLKVVPAAAPARKKKDQDEDLTPPLKVITKAKEQRFKDERGLKVTIILCTVILHMMLIVGVSSCFRMCLISLQLHNCISCMTVCGDLCCSLGPKED